MFSTTQLTLCLHVHYWCLALFSSSEMPCYISWNDPYMILISLCTLTRTNSETTFETNDIDVMEKCYTETLLFFSYYGSLILS